MLLEYALDFVALVNIALVYACIYRALSFTSGIMHVFPVFFFILLLL